MTLIKFVLGEPLGYLMFLCYKVSSNYGVALILFTVLSKIILFPVTMMSHVNSVRMAKIKPRVDDIKRHYSGIRERIDEETLKLYKAEKYNPFKDMLPLFIQLFLIIGLIYVMYNPLQYLLHIPQESIAVLTTKAAEISGVDSLGVTAQLRTADLLQNPANVSAFENAGLANFPELLDKIQHFNLTFFGMNLGMTPLITDFSILWAMPVFAGLTSLLLCLVQNKIHVLQKEQSHAYQWGMSAFFTVFSLYFGFVVPAGIGFYWGIGNLFAIATLVLCNCIYNPKKYIDYTNRTKPIPVDKSLQKANRGREKSDYKRFCDCKRKQLVFYAPKGSAYKYYKSVLEYVLENSDIMIHYVTSDPDDAIFQHGNPQLIPYYVGDRKLISLFINLDTNIMVMTTPDLQKYHIKRSSVRKDIEYVYMFHAIASSNLLLREGALNHYDTIFCASPHNAEEIRRTEKAYKLPPKKLLKCGYGLLDELIASYEAMPEKETSKTSILIAPSWQLDNIMETCLDDMLEKLLATDYKIILRSHPEFVKRFPGKILGIQTKYKDAIGENFIIQTDISDNTAVYQSSLVITDWSGIAYEFAYCTKRPVLFINTPMKVMNPNYKRLKLEPMDITLRKEIGMSIDPAHMDRLIPTIQELLENRDEYRENITQTLDRYVYNLGNGGEAGGQYIIKRLEKKARKR